MVLMDERTPPPGAYAEGVGRGRRRRVSLERLNLPHAPIIVTLSLSPQLFTPAE
jgi:hypothetical protein